MIPAPQDYEKANKLMDKFKFDLATDKLADWRHDAKLIAQTIADERERCAKIAETCFHLGDDAVTEHGKRIASAIRNHKDKKEGGR